MRARNLKPSFFKNEDLAECSFQSRILFQGLWCLADRNGNLENRPKHIKVEVFPYDVVDVPAMVQELARHKLVILYEVADRAYIHIPSWKKHARPHRDEPAAYPEPADQAQTAQAEKKPGAPDEIQIEHGELLVEPGENSASREKTGRVAPLPSSLFPHPESGMLNAEGGMPPSGGPSSSSKKTNEFSPTAEGCLDAWESVVTQGRVNRQEILAQVRELNRIGNSYETILREIVRPERCKNEPFFRISDRLTPQQKNGMARASPGADCQLPDVKVIRERNERREKELHSGPRFTFPGPA